VVTLGNVAEDSGFCERLYFLSSLHYPSSPKKLSERFHFSPGGSTLTHFIQVAINPFENMVIDPTATAFPFVPDVVVVARVNAGGLQVLIVLEHDINDFVPGQSLSRTQLALLDLLDKALVVCGVVWHRFISWTFNPKWERWKRLPSSPVRMHRISLYRTSPFPSTVDNLATEVREKIYC
jgi:hypothetical protein